MALPGLGAKKFLVARRCLTEVVVMQEVIALMCLTEVVVMQEVIALMHDRCASNASLRVFSVSHLNPEEPL